MGEAITLAVIGGTGLEKAFDHLDETIVVDTPFGPTSEPVAVGEVAARRVAFLPRHGRAHSLPPGSIPARANAWALASLGVRGIVSSAAVGSLDPALPPATLVIPDQLLDRTRHRADTFFDGTVPGEPVRHLPLADPFCPVLRRVRPPTRTRERRSPSSRGRGSPHGPSPSVCAATAPIWST